MYFIPDGSRWHIFISLSCFFASRPFSPSLFQSLSQWVQTRGRFRKYQYPLFSPLFQGKLTDIPCASINRKLSDSHMLVHIRTCAAYTRHAMMSCTEKFVYTETLETYSNGCYKSPLAGSLFFLRDLVSWVHFKSCLSWMCYWYLKTDRPHM